MASETYRARGEMTRLIALAHIPKHSAHIPETSAAELRNEA
jgi:hypothetical protein